MITTLGRIQDEALGDALANLLGRLRGYPLARLPALCEGAHGDDADRFAEKLAEHLRYAEETLFPALQELEPGSACDIEGLKKDHRLLHLYAQDLALQIRGGDKEEAHRVARSFLAVLLGHIDRETDGVDKFVRTLDVLDARRLSMALAERSPAIDAGASQYPLR